MYNLMLKFFEGCWVKGLNLTHKPFIECQFTDAREFLENLRPSNPIWSDKPEIEHLTWYRHWLFRGQSDGLNWRLEPAAWRHGDFMVEVIQQSLISEKIKLQEIVETKFKQTEATNIDRYTDILFQALCEYFLLSEYTTFANELGHRLPSVLTNILKDSPEVFVNDYISRLEKPEKLADLWGSPIIIMAQHHGIPTRLLDWTRNPLVAAYFAAANAKHNDDIPIAVYAVHPIILRGSSIFPIEIPQADDPYFHAQSAVLTLDTRADRYYLEHGHFPALEDTISKFPEDSTLDEPYFSKKLTLIASEVPELLRMLWLEGISQAHLMPTLDNITIALKMKMKFMPVPRNQET